MDLYSQIKVNNSSVGFQGGHFIEDDIPEFLHVTLDEDYKVIEGIQSDGTKFIGSDIIVNGDARVIGNVNIAGASYRVIESPEWIKVLIDAEDRILCGIKSDGTTYIGSIEGLDNKLQEMLYKMQQMLDEAKAEIDAKIAVFNEIFSFTDSPEFISVEIDSDGKILSSRSTDGVKKEYAGFETNNLSIEGHIIGNIEDPERRSEITTDTEGKIISYRDSNGVKHENVEIATNRLHLSDDGLTALERDLKEHGFISSLCDWSDAKELHIAEPQCAIINFKGITDVPTTKTADAKTIMEFWDMQGNYFKKETIVNAQGNSTLSHPKRGMTVDICNNNGWDDEDTFKLQIGDWVPQDSFHVKAYYADPFRCVSAIAYKLMDEVVKTRGEFDDYVWKKALLDLDSITATSNGASTADDTAKQFTNGARCISDGFPCIVYMEGEFYGIYAWQLKKHRDNYQMSKKKAKHIHLDGVLGLDTFFGIDDFDWMWFEVRNPKNLVYAEAHNDLKGKPTYKYDADDAGQFEIAGNHDGSTTYDTWTAGSYAVNKVVLHNSHYFLNTTDGNTAEPVYDSKNNSDDAPDFKNKTGCGWLNVTNTIKVKEYVIKLSKLKGTLETALATYDASSKTAEDLATFREAVEEYLDPDSMIDYYIVSEVLNNYDGFRKNWQWITYDGKKWYIVMWDCDGCLGNWWQLTDEIKPPLTAHIYTEFPYNCILAGWGDELKERYAELRKAGILSEHHITGMIREWHGRLGNKSAFDKEWERWPGFIKNDSILRVSRWLTESISNMDIVYNYNQN